MFVHSCCDAACVISRAGDFVGIITRASLIASTRDGGRHINNEMKRRRHRCEQDPLSPSSRGSSPKGEFRCQSGDLPLSPEPVSLGRAEILKPRKVRNVYPGSTIGNCSSFICSMR